MGIYVNSVIVDLILVGIVVLAVAFSLKRSALNCVLYTVVLILMFIISVIVAKTVPVIIMDHISRDLPTALRNFIESTVTIQLVFVVTFGALYIVAFKVVRIILTFITSFSIKRPLLSIPFGLVNGFIMTLVVVVLMSYINQFHGHNLAFSLDGVFGKFIGSIVQAIFDIPIDVNEIERMLSRDIW